MKLKDVIREREVVKFTNGDNRAIRKAMSELRAEGIIFVPIGDWIYKRTENCTNEEKEAFYRKQLSHLNTQYFQTVKPIQNHLRKDFLEEVHEGSLFSEMDRY